MLVGKDIFWNHCVTTSGREVRGGIRRKLLALHKLLGKQDMIVFCYLLLIPTEWTLRWSIVRIIEDKVEWWKAETVRSSLKNLERLGILSKYGNKRGKKGSPGIWVMNNIDPVTGDIIPLSETEIQETINSYSNIDNNSVEGQEEIGDSLYDF